MYALELKSGHKNHKMNADINTTLQIPQVLFVFQSNHMK